jgi:hypothetical protein
MWLKMGVRSPEDIPELATQNTLGSEDEASANEHKPKYTSRQYCHHHHSGLLVYGAGNDRFP